jgi:predicted Mrr-cat superfamily restriction endonuclease
MENCSNDFDNTQHEKSKMTDTRAWKFRPGSEEDTIREVLETGCIRLDYNVSGLRPQITRDKIIEALRVQNPKRSDKGVAAHAGQIAALFSKVKKGDLALVPRDKGRSMMIGRVVSDQPSVTGTKLEVVVTWLDPEVPVARFDQDLRYSFMAIHKFCGVSRNGATQRILAISQGEADPGAPENQVHMLENGR